MRETITSRRIFLTGTLVAAAGAVAVACGDKKQNTAPTQQAAVQPSAAADGRGLLLPRDQRLLLRSMSDGKEFVLKRGEADVFFTFPRWSPDGTLIVYARDTPYTGAPNQNWGSDIAVMPAAGGSERIVLQRPAPGVKVEGMDWSPDGAALYAAMLETRIQDGRFLGQTVKLERIELATGQRRPVIEDAAYPSVARDGSRIAYITFSSGDQSGGLWVANVDGSDRRLIVPATGKFVAVTQPRFSPDGRTVAFSAATLAAGSAPVPRERSVWRWRWPWQARTASAHGLPMDIWTVPAAGGEPRRLTNFAEDEPYPAWSPDGKQLAVIATGGLYTIPADGGEPRKVGLGGTQVQIDWR